MTLGKVTQMIATLAALATLCACAPLKNSGEFEGLSCGAADQHKSYMNPMDSTQVQTISVDSNFSDSEVKQIEAAVATWNAQGRRSLGRNIFTVQTFSLSTRSTPESRTDCGFPGTPNGFSIVKVNTSSWSNLGFPTNSPGVTLRCSSGKEFAAKQIILLNPTNIKSAPAIFESVILHELGHTIGLNHSCDAGNAGSEEYRSCSSLSGLSDPYREAVMYPYIDSNDHKEELASNDQQRASCALNYRP